ncbi:MULTISPECIES: enoyl-CoA hydratase/isomerase family protein [Micromonospora]|uniref:Enoyl-CoA hydratase/carnithine racemase n=1 Tax=Micromonospora yangpuensis TaxID=683228 RepID=A0A1C6UYW7_9ACTN|nr:enoyl-CoA hydratase/isomerase family protein [Micromonospora yangpuensis]GGL95158.1 enoyl-CoA hydratase [Micromonospora yangpuensis]SCL59000.1 Enoyl-CoA hydratase/carnithine racemase [Micromonospora yangpuensis]
MTAGSDGVRIDCAGPVATVTLCRPDVLNAQTPAMWRALVDISRELPGDVRVVVVRGEGRAFSAGLDLAVAGATGPGSFAELATLPEAECAQRIAEFQAAFTWLHRPDIVSVAAVQGHAIGAGFQLALACDLRVLAEDARLAMAEVTLGLVPDLAGTKRLVDLVGYSRALEICATGRRMDAAEADRIGLATLVVPTAELTDAVRDLTAGLLAHDRDAVVEIKALLAGAVNRNAADQQRAEREAQTRRLRDLAGRGE